MPDFSHFQTQIREHMPVVGSDGMQIGTVDRVEGQQIKLSKNSAADDCHHMIPADWVETVDNGKILLSVTSNQAQNQWESVD